MDSDNRSHASEVTTTPYTTSRTPRRVGLAALVVAEASALPGCGSYSHVRAVPSDGRSGKDYFSLEMFDPSVRPAPSERGNLQFYRNWCEMPNRPEDSGDHVMITYAPMSMLFGLVQTPFIFLDRLFYGTLGEPETDDETLTRGLKTTSRGIGHVPYAIHRFLGFLGDRLIGGSTSTRAIIGGEEENGGAYHGADQDLRTRHVVESIIVNGAAIGGGVGVGLSGGNGGGSHGPAGNPGTNNVLPGGGDNITDGAR